MYSIINLERQQKPVKALRITVLGLTLDIGILLYETRELTAHRECSVYVSTSEFCLYNESTAPTNLQRIAKKLLATFLYEAHALNVCPKPCIYTVAWFRMCSKSLNIINQLMDMQSHSQFGTRL
jgi:hypothetical protein